VASGSKGMQAKARPQTLTGGTLVPAMGAVASAVGSMNPPFYNVVVRYGAQPLPAAGGGLAMGDVTAVARSDGPAAADAQGAAERGRNAIEPSPRAGSTVRIAMRKDAETIEAMMRAAHQESPIYRAMPIDDRRLSGYIASVIRSKDHAVFLYESAAGIDGLYIGMLVQQFFTLEVTAMDILFYVRPERRGTRAAVQLWRAFRRWAEARGAKAIQVGTMTEIDPGRTAKFYRGMGLREIGGVFHARIG
jgi:GNAT superfamily N-acetyltransferase